jgi:hypothetical protein
MESPINNYKTLSQIDNIKSIAYDTIFTKYIIKSLRGEKKLMEWDSTDQESLILERNGGFPLPGFIYIFEYDKKGGAQFLNTGGVNKEFFDVVPLVFCTHVNTMTDNFEGINFNFLPPLERVKLLEAYYRAFQKFFENLEEKTQNNELALNKKFISFASSPIGGKIIKLFSKLASANFNYAYRKYKFDKIDNFRIIEYCEWNHIPFYEPKDAFRGANQKQIQTQYWKSDKNI